MVGSSDRHGLIAGNLFAAIHMALPEPCQAFVSDMKVRIRTDAKDIFYYPDILVTCDSRDRETYCREYPCLIVGKRSDPGADPPPKTSCVFNRR